MNHNCSKMDEMVSIEKDNDGLWYLRAYGTGYEPLVTLQLAHCPWCGVKPENEQLLREAWATSAFRGR